MASLTAIRDGHSERNMKPKVDKKPWFLMQIQLSMSSPSIGGSSTRRFGISKQCFPSLIYFTRVKVQAEINNYINKT